MKTVTLDYTAYMHKKFTIPQNSMWSDWFDVWIKDEDELTDEEYDFLESHTLAEFISEMTDDFIDRESIELYDYDE